MKTKYYKIERDPQGKIHSAKEIDTVSAIIASEKERIVLKGKMPRVGQRIQIAKFDEGIQVAKVTQVLANGLPIKAELDDGTVIELVGYVIQLVRFLQSILLALKRLWPGKKQKRAS